ncbi:hypothetical protein WME75_10660 [Sorangium sp. So ce1014]|uniref:hypothetical protein n=1 Tax=Sorangium sp. So ce1014 TaxID=3133326 RepID=UPI003F61F8EF
MATTTTQSLGRSVQDSDSEAQSPSSSYRDACARIRQRTHELNQLLTRNYLEIADLVAAAKVAYDAEHRTGRVGRRNPEGIPGFIKACARDAGLSTSTIEKYLRISRMSSFHRQALLEHPEATANVTGLLELVREADPEKVIARMTAPRAVAEAVETSPLFERAERDPALQAVLESFHDAKRLGGLDAKLPTPPDLVERIPELSAYATVGEVRDAIEQEKVRAKRSALRKMDPLESGVGLVRVCGRIHPGEWTKLELMHGRKRCRHQIRVVSIRVPRAALEEALKSTEDKGDDQGANVQLPVLDGIVHFVMQ